MDFFTEDDLQLLHEYKEQEYRDTRKAAAVQHTLSTGVWAKTKHWAELSGGEDYQVDCRISVLRRAGTKKGSDRGKQRMLRRFRAYTWARLYRPGENDYQVFFTVGVDGERQELVWKLDCKREGSGALDSRQVARFTAYQEREAPVIAWQSVSLKKLRGWSWDRLVATTQKFIKDNVAVYEEAIRQTWAGHEPGRDKLARVCWNDFGWQRPSGPAGKSDIDETHEASEGWGAEEWLFDFERLVDGYHYAYLTPIRKGIAKHAGASYNIRLYTRDAVTGTYYYVGRLRNAQVLTTAEIAVMTALYEGQKWLRSMEEDVQAVTGDADFALNPGEGGPFNIRFRPEDVERPTSSDGLDIISNITEWTSSTRYVLLDDVRANESFDDRKTTEGDDLDMDGHDEPNPVRRPRRRLLRTGAVELPGLHDLVQDRLVVHLRSLYPRQRIKREVHVKQHGTRIDVVRQLPNKNRIFYEVKVLPTLRACVREALGQLLEYAHWPAKSLATGLVIVSHHPSDGETAAYLTKLSETYGLDIGYLYIPSHDQPTK